MARQPREWVDCPICGLYVSLSYGSGVIKLHGPREKPCVASGVTPESLAAAASLLVTPYVPSG